ncbi:ATP-dependent serine protease [Leucobacter sp. UCD-THU]|uniref:YlbL family protein n=1 Tax=Leucobacter sp. UCD-THU TaxID=1292023 RepID=UPI00036C9284|nr:S16 family serine protease [Leucobacter sp. UCD-THU]EYT52976.1 ATP-dependent serine protease [Leucobacter sp. UCD-THU]
MNDDRIERRRLRIMLALALVACAVLLAALIPSPFVVERPGPVVNTLGEVELEDGEVEPVISVDDAELYEADGELNLLTVSILGDPAHPRSWLSLVPSLFDPAQRVAPVAEFYPEGVTLEQRQTQNAAYMDSSQMQAAAAAFRWLGEAVPVELSVAAVIEDGPSDGVLREGDVLLTADGAPIADFAELRALVTETGAGGRIVLGIEREGVPQEAAIEPRIPQGGDEPLIGATIASSYELPNEVDISLSQIGGPSAGLVFALGLVERLTPGTMVDGSIISATGTISGTGEVGAIGGLAQKMWAADRAESDLFLMPIGNCGDLPERRPEGLRIAPVATLDEAISAVEAVAAGEEPAGLERCGAGA